MPQGKGTYGSKVGRPSKKKYQAGGSVKMGNDPFSTRNPEGLPSEQIMEAIGEKNDLEETPSLNAIPSANAQERSQKSPDMTEYKEGGKVDKIRKAKKDVIKSAGRRSKFYVKPEKQYFKGKEMKPVPMPSPKPSKQKAVPLPEPKLSDKEWALRHGLKMGKKKKRKKK